MQPNGLVSGGQTPGFIRNARDAALIAVSVLGIFSAQTMAQQAESVESDDAHPDSAAPGANANKEEAALPRTPSGAFRFLAHSNLVLVPVTVTTGNGRAVTGLAKEDFSVFEDKSEQLIKEFTCEDAPAAIGVVFDASDSMEPKLKKAREAVYALLRGANPADEFFLIRFSDYAELTVPLTHDVEEIRRATDNLSIHGSTAIFDAMKMAWLEMGKAQQTRKAIILISDGEDNSSHITADEFKHLAAESDTTIYTLFVGEMPDMDPSVNWIARSGLILLDNIAKQTGGRMFMVSRVKQLPGITATIGAWIHAQYVLGYVPSSESLNGRYHKIKVKVQRPDRFPKLHYNWRMGYYAAGP